MAEEEQKDFDRELYRCPISSPFSSDKPKLTKKLYSIIFKAVAANKKRGVTKGIKDVTKAVRKGAKGIVVIGADVSPFDVVSHLPVLLEEKKVPYVFVPSRSDLGAATQCKRATTVVLLRPNEETMSSYEKCVSAIEELNEAPAE
jgi:H/ACA ribonucleoprotein complex subunit 2